MEKIPGEHLLDMALSFRDLANLGKYQDMRGRIHVDEKWFFSHEGEGNVFAASW